MESLPIFSLFVIKTSDHLVSALTNQKDGKLTEKTPQGKRNHLIHFTDTEMLYSELQNTGRDLNSLLHCLIKFVIQASYTLLSLLKCKWLFFFYIQHFLNVQKQLEASSSRLV